MQRSESFELFPTRTMKLVDFTSHSVLNELRQQMNAPLIELEASRWTILDPEELRRKLNSIEGIEVDIAEILTSANGTFEYKGQKVVVYIRDQYANPRYPDREYKFHIANCETMEKAFAKGRADRYVVSTRTDGRFLVNVRDFYSRSVMKENAIEDLHVCKNCLLRLRYKGYYSHATGKQIYSTFALSAFFQAYGGTQITRKPRHTDITAPPDEYSLDFDKLSRLLKEKNGWQCEQCGLDLKEYKEFLHSHHKNGLKGDNSLDNLTTLCVRCHAKVPEHGHLKFSPDYTRFIQIFGQ